LSPPATKPWDLIQIGVGVISAALGIAVAASGIGRTVVAVITWVVVAVGVGLVIAGSLRLRARRRRRAAVSAAPSEPRLADRLINLGTRITAFKQDRDAQAPPPASAESHLLHPFRAARVRHAEAVSLAAYNDDTLSLYDQRFKREAWILVRELLIAGGVGENEAEALVNAEHVEDIEWIGLRLTELGARQPRRYRPVA
jgi:hypothetical protein